MTRRVGLAPILGVAVAGGCAKPTGPSPSPTRPSSSEAPAEPRSDTATASKRAEPVGSADDGELEQLRNDYEAIQGKPQHLAWLAERVERYLQRHPQSTGAMMLLADAYLEQSKLSDALSLANRCVAEDPEGMPQCWLMIGVVNEAQRSADAAIEGYQKYLEVAPEGLYRAEVERSLQRLGATPPGPR